MSMMSSANLETQGAPANGAKRAFRLRPSRGKGHDNLTIPMESTSLNLALDMQQPFSKKLHFDKFALWILGVQTVIIVLFYVFTQYGPAPAVPGALPAAPTDVVVYYQFMRDVSVMCVIGFAYLMTFLKRLALLARSHRFSAIGYTFFITVIVVEWALLLNGFYRWVHHRDLTGITFGFADMVMALFCAASILISFGAWIGKIGPEQLLFIALCEAAVYCTNSFIIEALLEVRDVGGSMVIHMFGAYFGLAASKFLSPADTRERAAYAGASYTSDTFSMIGTIFLWIMWPSFNAALVPAIRQHYAIFNTFLALCAAVFVTFACSRMFRFSRHFTMEDLQNATLAGGVAMGASADILFSPGTALLLGSLAGILSVAGFAFISPVLQRRLGIYDSCGVHNLHGMPSILAAIASSIVCYRVGTSPVADLAHGTLQWGYQLACMCVTLLISIVGGILFGWLTSVLPIPKPQLVQLFDDEEYFELPDTYEAGVKPAQATFSQPMAMDQAADSVNQRRASAMTDAEVSEVNVGVIDL